VFAEGCGRAAKSRQGDFAVCGRAAKSRQGLFESFDLCRKSKIKRKLKNKIRYFVGFSFSFSGYIITDEAAVDIFLSTVMIVCQENSPVKEISCRPFFRRAGYCCKCPAYRNERLFHFYM
jgi:hypothetical protein